MVKRIAGEDETVSQGCDTKALLLSFLRWRCCVGGEIEAPKKEMTPFAQKPMRFSDWPVLDIPVKRADHFYFASDLTKKSSGSTRVSSSRTAS